MEGENEIQARLQLYENLQYGGNLLTAKPDYGL